MDPILIAVLALVLVFAACCGWFLNFVGLPGNWIVVGLATIYALIIPSESRFDIAWGWVLALFLLAVLGEVIEFIAGAAGAKKLGGSWRGAGLALVGSFAGALLGLLVGLPLPIIGPLVASILGGALGAMAGAILGELWLGRGAGFGWQVGQAAFWGKLWGTLGKLAVGIVIVIALVLAVLL